jgi:pimeloyl-ACP methyl ester carboxylesterase
MRQRNTTLVQRGFNVTSSFTLARVSGKTAALELLIPPTDAPHELSFWAHAVGGNVALRVVASDERLVASWVGQSGEKSLTVKLPSGHAHIEVDGTHAQLVFAVLGIKGPVVPSCHLDTGRISTQSAKTAAGFHWPYILYIPHELRAPRLLVAPNNTGFATSDPELVVASGTCTAATNAALADHLGTPLLVPLFPRPPVEGEEQNLYLHALTRATLLAQDPKYKRIDLQLIAMLDDAARALASRNIKVSRRALISGFSASGSFASRFAMLHPDRVLAVAAGSPGGWPIAPLARDGACVLPYPVGIADLKSLIGTAPSARSLRRVSWFFFLGDADTNDSVSDRDSFSAADESLVETHFGASLRARWEAAERLYRNAGLNAKFKLYPGVSHQISKEMEHDIAAFFLAALKNGR